MDKIVDTLNKEELAFSEEEKLLYHKNCAEILLMAVNEKYKLNLSDDFFHAVFPFGGGMQVESTCGALTGAIVALGILYTKKKPSTNEKVKYITEKFIREFEKEFGALDCKYIKEHHRCPVTGCDLVKVRTARVLEKTMNEEENTK